MLTPRNQITKTAGNVDGLLEGLTRMGGLAARTSRTTLARGHRGTLSAKTGARARRPPPARAAVVPFPARPDSGGTRPHAHLTTGPPLQPAGLLPQGTGGVIPPKLGHL